MLSPTTMPDGLFGCIEEPGTSCKEGLITLSFDGSVARTGVLIIFP